MNYYRHNSVEETRIQFTTMTHIPALHWKTNYKPIPDKSHDSLQRCGTCKIKYDMHLLIRVTVGIFICKFCRKVGV